MHLYLSSHCVPRVFIPSFLSLVLVCTHACVCVRESGEGESGEETDGEARLGCPVIVVPQEAK